MSTAKRRPRIGLSCNYMHADPERALFRGKALHYVEARMSAAVWRGGGHPVLLLDVGDPVALDDQVAELDGLLLTGGADVAPQTYGQDPQDPRWTGDPVRDLYEIGLIKRAEKRGIPILGICRGVQLMTAAFGGSLWQDINTDIEGTAVHRDWHRYDQLGHPVKVEAGSWLSDIYDGQTDLAVNSIHHQSVRDIPPGFRCTARAPDGVIEALESIRDDRFVVGLQWHPEWLENDRVASDPDAKGWAPGGPVFERFAQRCARASEPNA